MHATIRKALKGFVDSAIVPVVSYVSSVVPPRPVLTPRPSTEREALALRAELASRAPGNPALKGFKVFSQNDEDGIIEEILRRVGTVDAPNRTFIEIGCADGLENNTYYLLLKGYKGCWVDGAEDHIASIRAILGDLQCDRLQVRRAFVDTSNVRRLVEEQAKFLGTTEPDFLSLDIDGNDLCVLQEALRSIRPKVICAEYNAKFPPPLSVSVAYNPSHTWAHDDYHGASLQALCDGLSNYRLVCCNLCGVNAFFVRVGLDAGFAEATPAELYQPFREQLTCPIAGHPPSLKWLRDSLASAKAER